MKSLKLMSLTITEMNVTGYIEAYLRLIALSLLPILLEPG